MSTATLDRDTAAQIVLASLQTVLEQADEPVPPTLGPDTVLVGPTALLDSLGVVALIVEIEQRLEIDHEVSLTLANDRAMSQRHSPFRTVAVLTDYVVALAQEAAR